MTSTSWQIAGGLLLFVVFGIKAAMLPVGFWLPKTYAVASTPVAAIFTIMTKVGIYAILRVNGTVFDDAMAQSILKHTIVDWPDHFNLWGDWCNWCGTAYVVLLASWCCHLWVHC